MCGVAGFINLDNTPASETVLNKMRDSLSHRGPDGFGNFIDTNVGLAHRRLSIIDLSKNAKQPMISNSERYVITYNGEVYNFKEIRRDLEKKGYNFISNSDTEVVLNSYIEWGEKCLERFNGMFAFCVLDRKKKNLFIGRDRYGIKPLYILKSDKKFAFASENKAFFEAGLIKREINKLGLAEYFTFQNFLTNNTLYKNIEVFPAGHYANISTITGKIELTQYWDFYFREPQEELEYGGYLEELDYLVRQAVNRQLISDVEIGTFLSGGMDSGSITALAAKQLPYIKTFTVGFDLSSASGLEMSFDERVKAEHMSYLFKTEHYEMVLKSGDMERCMPSLAHHLEEPRVGQSYPNFYASKLASRFTKVVLSGAGGDEIFAGYPWRYYRSVGHRDFESYIDDYFNYWQRLLPSSQYEKALRPLGINIKESDMKDIFKAVYLNHKNNLETPEDFINHSLYFEAKTFLHGLLIVEDKLSMAHSLETRVPFLDNDLVDFSLKIPLKYKLSNLGEVVRINENEIGDKSRKYFKKTSDGKLILRKVMENYIPKSVTSRVKQGFSSPDSSWFKGESIDFVKRELMSRENKLYSYMDFDCAQELINEHLSARSNNRLAIWSFLNLSELLKGI